MAHHVFTLNSQGRYNPSRHANIAQFDTITINAAPGWEDTVNFPPSLLLENRRGAALSSPLTVPTLSTEIVVKSSEGTFELSGNPHRWMNPGHQEAGATHSDAKSGGGGGTGGVTIQINPSGG